MMFATTFVMLQTPAAGFAQGGLVRRKNALSVIGQSFMGVVIGCLLWYVLNTLNTFFAHFCGVGTQHTSGATATPTEATETPPC